MFKSVVTFCTGFWQMSTKSWITQNRLRQREYSEHRTYPLSVYGLQTLTLNRVPREIEKTLETRLLTTKPWDTHHLFYFIPGYGHMTPSTFAGRMFCIFYALVGIPLCMLTLKVMGDKINELLGNFFIIISTKRQLRDRKGTKIKVMLTLTGLVLVFLFLGGTLYLSEDWSYFDGVYYCFIGKVIMSYRMSIEVLEFHSLFIRRSVD